MTCLVTLIYVLFNNQNLSNTYQRRYTLLELQSDPGPSISNKFLFFDHMQLKMTGFIPLKNVTLHDEVALHGGRVGDQPSYDAFQSRRTLL